MKQGTVYVGVAQRGRSRLLSRLVQDGVANGRGVYMLIVGDVLPAHAPELAVDPQDVQEALAVMLAAHPTIRQAAVDGFAQMADDADESDCGQSVATDTLVGVNHKAGSASDLGFHRRWVAPPSGLELASGSCRRVRVTVPPSTSERERRGTRPASCRSVRVTLASSVANPVTTSRAPRGRTPAKEGR